MRVAVLCLALTLHLSAGGHDFAYAVTVPAQSTVVVNPLHLAGLSIYPQQPFRMDFIVNAGAGHLNQDELKAESQKLVNYFLAALTVPADQMWVNLSPYEKTRIVAPGLGATAMGRDMLTQDYVLKQTSASLFNPDQTIGRQFWQEVYKHAGQDQRAKINAFNKVWIMPDKAEVVVDGRSVFIKSMHMKVMLEEDVRAQQANAQPLSTGSSQFMRRIVLPAIEARVNTADDFANLRQMVQALVLASWYKKHLKASIMNRIYADKNKIKGIDLKEQGAVESIYKRYLALFKQGAYRFIKEDDDPYSNKHIPRKYVAGGFLSGAAADPIVLAGTAPVMAGQKARVTVDLAMIQSGGHLRVDPDFIKVSFTDHRIHSMDALKPGQVMINAGREYHAAVIDGKITAILDHHHLGNDATVPRSASALIWKDAPDLRTRGQIDEVITNYSPDFDTIIAIMLLDILKDHGDFPPYMKELVAYATQWDSGRAYLTGLTSSQSREEAAAARVADLKHSLGAFIKGVLSTVDAYPVARYFDQIKDRYGMEKEEDLYAAAVPQEIKKKVLDEINAMRSIERVRMVKIIITQLYAGGYKGEERNFQVNENDFPQDMRPLYRAVTAATDKDFESIILDKRIIPDLDETRGQYEHPVRMQLFVDGNKISRNGPRAEERFTHIDMPLFKNPDTRDFFYYLYLTGEKSGIHYGSRSKRIKKIRNIPLDEHIVARSVGIAVSEYAGVSVRGLAEYLNDAEQKRRVALQMSPEPHGENGDHVFWKETLQGRKIQSMEGSVFTADELMHVLQAYDPRESVQVHFEEELNEVIDHLGRLDMITKAGLIFNKPVAHVFIRRFIFTEAIISALAGIALPPSLIELLPIEIIVDIGFWGFIAVRYTKVLIEFKRQHGALMKLIGLVSAFMAADHVQDQEAVFEDMIALIPQIKHFKPQHLLVAIEQKLLEQPLPVRFGKRLRELWEKLAMEYYTSSAPADAPEPDADEAMTPGGIDLNDTQLHLKETGANTQQELPAVYQAIDPATVLGLHPRIVNISIISS